jgi:hypothetical protein
VGGDGALLVDVVVDRPVGATGAGSDVRFRAGTVVVVVVLDGVVVVVVSNGPGSWPVRARNSASRFANRARNAERSRRASPMTDETKSTASTTAIDTNEQIRSATSVRRRAVRSTICHAFPVTGGG